MDNNLSYFKNHDLVDFGGKNKPSSEGMLEFKLSNSTLHVKSQPMSNMDKDEINVPINYLK